MAGSRVRSGEQSVEFDPLADPKANPEYPEGYKLEIADVDVGCVRAARLWG